MAFMEGKLQLIDLLGAAEFARNQKRQQQQAQAQAQQDELKRRLMQQQVEAGDFQNMMMKDRPKITLPAGPGLGGMRSKQFLDDQAGYISGVSPTDTFNQWNQNFRQGMASGGGGYGGGRGGDMPSPDDDRFNSAKADVAEDQARQEQYKRQGRGGGTADLLAEQVLGLKGKAADDKAYDALINDARDASKKRWSVINAGDQAIANVKATGNELRSEVEKTQAGAQEQVDAKTVAINRGTKELNSFPGFDELNSDEKQELLNSVPMEIEKALLSGKKAVDWGRLIKEKRSTKK